MANKILFSLVTATLLALPSCGDDDDSDGTATGGRTATGGSSSAGRGGGGSGNGGATSKGGGTSGGATSGGATAGGATSGGATSGGATSGGATAGGEGGTGIVGGEGGEATGGIGGATDAGAGGQTNAGGSGGAAVEGGAGGAAGGDGAPTAGAGGEGGEALVLSDAQILHVTATANQGEIEQGTIALDRAQTESVDEFAQMMVSQHGAALADGSELAQQLGLAGNALSMQLQSESAAIVAQLQLAEDAEFDAVYMNAQVAAHERVLGVLDDELIPDADDTALRDYLETLRTSVADHLEMARDMVEELP
jgi:predicted outer membrane protein